MSIVLIGDPFERASSAADPAVEPTSIAPARSASLALFDPADCTQLTFTSEPNSSSSQPWSLRIRLRGLYVAKSMLSVEALQPSAPGSVAGAPSPATQPVSARAAVAAIAVRAAKGFFMSGFPFEDAVDGCARSEDRR